jgi:hypothetical protein
MICRYPEECPRVQDAKVHAGAIAKEDDLIDKLYHVNKGMLFLQQQSETRSTLL